MPTYNKKPSFFDTEEGLEIERILRSMSADAAYNTRSSYTANTLRYPDNLIPFVDKQMDYLRSHPAIDPKHFIANLQLMTRIK